MAKKIDYIIDEWDVLMPRKGMPIDGGKAQTEKLMKACENKDVKLTVQDKLNSGYPLGDREKQLICEGKIYKEGVQVSK